MRSRLKPDHRLGHPLPKTIVIVRALPGLGDFLCWMPALRSLRMALPDAQITWIGLPESADLAQRFPNLIDQRLAFPGYPGIPEVAVSPQRTVTFLLQMQQLNFDLALQMHGSGAIINGFTLLLGAQRNAGFFPSGQSCPDRNRFFPYPEHASEVWRHLHLLESLGIPSQGDQLEFPIWQSDWHESEAILSAHDLQPENYICIHPGASSITKQWPYQKFAVVADRLAAQGYQIILTGTAAEHELAQAISRSMQFPSIDLTGQTSLGAIAALLTQAALLICNDTGISHLAAALQVNSVVVFSNADLNRWAPLDRKRHRAIDSSRAGNPKLHPSSDPIIEQVLVAAHDLLQQECVHVS